MVVGGSRGTTRRFRAWWRDDSGIVLRGGCAIAWMIILFLTALASGSAELWGFFGINFLIFILMTAFSGSSSRASDPRSIHEASRAGQVASAPRVSGQPAASPRVDPIIMKTRLLRKHYASDIAELGDDAVRVLRTELERQFGEKEIAARWPEIHRALLARGESA